MTTNKTKTDDYMTWLEQVNPKGAEELKDKIAKYEADCKSKGMQTLYEKRDIQPRINLGQRCVKGQHKWTYKGEDEEQNSIFDCEKCMTRQYRMM